MKRLLLSGLLTLSSFAAAYGADFESLKSERKQIFEKVQRGAGTAADTKRFREITNQMRDIVSQEFQKHDQQTKDTLDQFNRIQEQQDEIRKSLFSDQGQKFSATRPEETYENVAPPEGEKMKVNPNGIILDNSTDTLLQGPTTQITPTFAAPVTSIQNTFPLMRGSIAVVNYDKLMDTALQNSEDLQDVLKKLAKYQKPTEKIKAFTAESITFFVPYRGFSQSRDGAKILLDQDMKVNSISSAQLEQLKIVDRIHERLVSSVLQLAWCIGNRDNTGAEKAMMYLRPMLGKVQADSFRTALEATDSSIIVDDLPKEDVFTEKKSLDKTLKLVVERDKLSQNLIAQIRRLQPSGKSMVTSRVVSPIVGVAEIGPWWIGLPARGVYTAYSMATGGQESSKLLKEIYLGKALESRVNLLTEETHLVLQNYSRSILTKNAPLYSASKSLLSQMTGDSAKL